MTQEASIREAQRDRFPPLRSFVARLLALQVAAVTGMAAIGQFVGRKETFSRLWGDGMLKSLPWVGGALFIYDWLSKAHKAQQVTAPAPVASSAAAPFSDHASRSHAQRIVEERASASSDMAQRVR